ncbi:MAG: glycosyltransferase family 2 protein [Patescibacteria group bacterium]|jgi:hypothetical protein
MSNEVDLSIVIVTWNSEKDISDCLTSIENAKQNLNIEVFVVDNNSKDNTIKVITDSHTGINLVQNTVNNGFAKANNQAIKQSRGEYVLLLNPDTRLKENTLIGSIDYMQNHKKVGILGCAIHNPDGTMQYSVRKFPALLSQILVLCKLHNFFPNLKPIKEYFALDFDYTKEQKVDQVMGAYMFLRHSCVEQIGVLDEGFWIWFEDVDYCKRAKSADWEVMYSPEFSIIHNQSQSFARLWAVKEQKLFNRSLLYYMKKHHGRFVYGILMMFVPISIVLSAIVGVFENKNNKISVQ